MADLLALLDSAAEEAAAVIDAFLQDLMPEPPPQRETRAMVDEALRNPAVYEQIMGELLDRVGPEEYDRQLRLAGSRLAREKEG